MPVWTTTDIPPGGEGKIEVSFDTHGKRGAQKKTVTVTSNDPANPTTTLTVSATVVVEFGFELYNINFGKLHPEQTASKTVPLLILDPGKVQVAEVTSNSEYVTARLLSSTADRNEVEVTLLPGMPTGYFAAEVTAKPTQESMPAAVLAVTGTILGNVEAVPEEFRYKLTKSKLEPEILTQSVTLRSTRETGRFSIVSVEDPDGRVTLKLDTVVAGSQYKLSATLKSSAIDAGNAQGRVLVQTDDPTGNTLAIPYAVLIRDESSDAVGAKTLTTSPKKR